MVRRWRLVFWLLDRAQRASPSMGASKYLVANRWLIDDLFDRHAGCVSRLPHADPGVAQVPPHDSAEVDPFFMSRRRLVGVRRVVPDFVSLISLLLLVLPQRSGLLL